MIDPDEASEKLAAIFPDLDAAELRAGLADRSRRFMWIKRGLPPAMAQRIHDLGLPGLAFRDEPKRAYPQGRLAGHVLGSVGIDNRGLAGIERHIDDALGLETGYSSDYARPPVTLTLDLGAQHGLEEELSLALAQYGASGAAGVIMDLSNGAVLAAATLPDIDPGRPVEAMIADRVDRLGMATYELGSVLKIFTVAMALEHGLATPSSVIDVRVPLQVGRWTIRDVAPSGRPLTVREVLVQSSNIGVAQLGLQAGAARQRAFLERLGLVDAMRWEAGALGLPRLPARWGEAEVATISYGYGIAVSPLQFATAAVPLINGGRRVRPHVIETLAGHRARNRARRTSRLGGDECRDARHVAPRGVEPQWHRTSRRRRRLRGRRQDRHGGDGEPGRLRGALRGGLVPRRLPDERTALSRARDFDRAACRAATRRSHRCRRHRCPGRRPRDRAHRTTIGRGATVGLDPAGLTISGPHRINT